MSSLRNRVIPGLWALVLLVFQILPTLLGSEDPEEASRSLAPYFTPATSSPKAPDKDGFLQRWMFLEPISKPNRTNTGFADTYIRNAMNTEYLPNQFAVIPRNGDKVTVEGRKLAWHALDSTNFNVKLFRFAYSLDRPTYGVLFWAVGRSTPTVANFAPVSDKGRWNFRKL